MENNFCTKTIDPIKCGICEFLNVNTVLLPKMTMYSCKKKAPDCYYHELTTLLKYCPLLADPLQSIQNRVTKLEKAVFNEEVKIDKYSWDNLQAENAQLKEELVKMQESINHRDMNLSMKRDDIKRIKISFSKESNK